MTTDTNMSIQQAIDTIMQRLDQIRAMQSAIAYALKEEAPDVANHLRMIIGPVVESGQFDGQDVSYFQAVLEALDRQHTPTDPQPSPKIRLVVHNPD